MRRVWKSGCNATPSRPLPPIAETATSPYNARVSPDVSQADFDPDYAQVDNLKIPPHSIEAEQSVLGGLMLDNQNWDQISDRVVDTDFYRQDHRTIFRAISDLADKGEPFDVITLSEWLNSRHELEKAGGLSYLGTLAKDTPSAANIKAYAEIVRERSILRELIAVSSRVADSAYNPVASPHRAVGRYVNAAD